MDRGGTQRGMWNWLLPIDYKTNILPCFKIRLVLQPTFKGTTMGILCH